MLSLSGSDLLSFRERGFVVLRRAFEAAPLRDEIERALASAAPARFDAELDTGAIQGLYLPLMTARSPHSLALFDSLEPLAEQLLDSSVLPVRAKGVRYFESTPWHVDSTLELASVGFAAYFEPLLAENGALRVVPGSQRGASAQPELALETEPGDLIAFDEHLSHSSRGGQSRLQWRADYVRAPLTPADDALVRRYFAGIYRPDWDGGYDVDAFPSYDLAWQHSTRPAALELGRLGVYELCAAAEAFARSGRARTSS